ncbi:MAG: 30S ribosomal protein S15 [Bdellovibrionales bacterium]|nr:30S ribosomal protein S15 [Bdellovibrionales bacterium]
MSLEGNSDKSEIVSKYKRSDSDTGSPEVQVALITDRLNNLTEHLKTNPKDKHSYRGLLSLVARRRGLLDYLLGVSPERYSSLISSLGIRK